MSTEIDDLARALWDSCPTVKPDWDQLGEVTKNVWREKALAGETPTSRNTFAEAGGAQARVGARGAESSDAAAGTTEGVEGTRQTGAAQPALQPVEPEEGLQGSLF